MSESGHFLPISDVCAIVRFPPIATKLLLYGKRREGPISGKSAPHLHLQWHASLV
jgi:ATP adenylyltransferase/5',5'''-P-1,P-4-tetraphosphate phosphorylase II